TFFDNEGPREHDPSLRWTFHVLRGYQERAELAMGKAVELRKDLEPLPRAQLDGIATQVSRVYTGEAFAVRSDAVAELLRLERCLQNLAAGRGVLHGMSGVVATAMPHGDIMQPCLLRLPADDAPRPMVVFATGAPAYGVGARRPAAPQTREANWLMREVGDFGVEQGWHVVACDSPGGGRPYPAALLSTLQALPQVLPTGGRKPLLVCDREAAAVVSLQLANFAPHVSGVVLVGSCAVPGPVLDRIDGLPVRFVALDGYPASQGFTRLMAFVEARSQEDNEGLDLATLHRRSTPWPFGPSWSRPELEAFAVEVFGER
ncbi:MAG: hypothetical protein KAI24_09825, partial [Planctomycetes bacterium]|nr:hypothetical protein [Planctomycetota bacterium]